MTHTRCILLEREIRTAWCGKWVPDGPVFRNVDLALSHRLREGDGYVCSDCVDTVCAWLKSKSSDDAIKTIASIKERSGTGGRG